MWKAASGGANWTLSGYVVTLASGAAGFFFGLFLRSMSEIGVTSIVGAMAVAWGLSQVLGPGGPSTTAWCLATAVLAIAGMAVQSMRKDKPAAAAETAEASPPQA